MPFYVMRFLNSVKPPRLILELGSFEIQQVEKESCLVQRWPPQVS